MSWFSHRGARNALAVNIAAGCYAGILIASVGLVTQFVADITDCSRYETEAKCSAPRHSGCVWRGDAGVCAFSTWKADCTGHTVATCPTSGGVCGLIKDDASPGAEKCSFRHGWVAWQLGVFAGVFILGGMIGSPLASLLVERLGQRPVIMLCGAIGLTSTLVEVLAWELNSYWLNVAARLVSGTAMGMMYVIAPLYVAEVAPLATRQTIGVCFQVGLCLSSTFTAGVGLAINPKANGIGAGETVRWMTAYHGIAAVGAAVFIPIGFWVQESSAWLSRGNRHVRGQAGDGKPAPSADAHLPHVSFAPSRVVGESCAELAALDVSRSAVQAPNPVKDTLPQSGAPDGSAPGGSPIRSVFQVSRMLTATSTDNLLGGHGSVGDFDTEAVTRATPPAEAQHVGLALQGVDAVDAISSDELRSVSEVPSSLRARLAIVAFPGLVAVVLAVAEQFTGINATISFAPSVMEIIGVEPLLGLFLVMAAHLVFSFFSIPVARRFSLRWMYLGGLAVAAPACLLTGIAAMPGWVANPTASTAIGLAGIALFTLGFEAGMAPSFYVLAQSIFPPSVRSMGCSFTMWVQFTFNLMMNAGFPSVREALSGGAGGDPNKGQGILFLAFGFIGAVTWVFLFCTLRISGPEPAPTAAESRRGSRTNAMPQGLSVSRRSSCDRGPRRSSVDTTRCPEVE